MWDSRAREKHWIQKEWPIRKNLEVGMQNIVNEPIVSRQKIVFPPLHLKLGFMKQFVKTLNEDGMEDDFKYILTTFPALSCEKIKAGVFDGPQIRVLVRDENFVHVMTGKEKAAWLSFKAIIQDFLGNKRQRTIKHWLRK